MADPELDALARTARQRRRLTPNAACEACQETRHLVAAPDGRVLCYACRRAEGGAGPTEGDHPAGRRNLGGLVVHLHANDHRTVTEMRARLGIDDWPDAGDDPLLTLAHFLAGTASLLLLVAEWLVEVAGELAGRLGPARWAGVRPAPMVLR